MADTKATLQILSTTPNGGNITTNIGYVNPNATDEKLHTLGVLLNGLTDNTLRGFQKVVTSTLTGNYPFYAIPDSGEIVMGSGVFTKGSYISTNIDPSTEVEFEVSIPDATQLTGTITRADTDSTRFILMLVHSTFGNRETGEHIATITCKQGDTEVAAPFQIKIIVEE